MSLALSDTIDSPDTLPRASHGTCTQCERSCFLSQTFPLLLSPLFMHLKLSVVCPSAMASRFSWKSSHAHHFSRALLYPEAEPQKGGRGQEGDVPPSRQVTPCIEGVPAQILPSSTLAFSTICHKVQGSSTGDPDETSLPSQSPWWRPGFWRYVIQVYQETYNSIHGLFFFSFLSPGYLLLVMAKETEVTPPLVCPFMSLFSLPELL